MSLVLDLSNAEERAKLRKPAVPAVRIQAAPARAPQDQQRGSGPAQPAVAAAAAAAAVLRSDREISAVEVSSPESVEDSSRAATDQPASSPAAAPSMRAAFEKLASGKYK